MRNNNTGTFENAVKDALDSLKFCPGLGAIENKDRAKFQSQDSRSVVGSVNIDKDIQPLYPCEYRWDYAVGYCSNGIEKVYFVEIHSAITSEVSCVIRKAKALREWAQKKAPKLWNMQRGVPGKLHWIASGNINIPKNTPQYRLLSTNPAIIFPQKSLHMK